MNKKIVGFDSSDNENKYSRSDLREDLSFALKLLVVAGMLFLAGYFAMVAL